MLNSDELHMLTNQPTESVVAEPEASKSLVSKPAIGHYPEPVPPTSDLNNLHS